MKVNVRKIQGPWDLGYSLDKHSISSTYTGDNAQGHATFDTVRSEVGEALFQLKYRSNTKQAEMISTQMAKSLGGYFPSCSVVIPMPPSKKRRIQPVQEIAEQLAGKWGIAYFDDLLIKTGRTKQMKDIEQTEDKIDALCAAFSVSDVLEDGPYDVLLIDDLYDTGSSLEAATIALREYEKIKNIFVATATRRR